LALAVRISMHGPKDWILTNCRFSQQQNFDFYNPAEYSPAKPLYEQQDQQFWSFVKTEANPTVIDPAVALKTVLNNHPDHARAFLNAYQNIYDMKQVQLNEATMLNVVKLGRNVFIVTLDGFPEIKNASDWIYELGEWELDELVAPKDFNAEFWDGVGPGYYLYHATSNDNLESIQQNGLNASDKTRGISNRDMGNAVFTAPQPETIDSYGDTVLKIDVGAMKAAGYMPEVSQESPFGQETQRSTLAYKLGIDDWIGGEYGSEGLAEDTVAFFDNIPPQFLSVYSNPRQAWVRSNCKFSAYSTDLAMLRDYLKEGVSPHDFPYLLERYFESYGNLPENFDAEEPYNHLDSMSEPELKDFKNWLVNNHHLLDSDDPNNPSYLHFNYNSIVPPGTWLVHFSDDASAIGRNGFEFGHEDMGNLGLTTYFKDTVRKRQPGWNFAFEALSRYAKTAASRNKYGKHAVLFQAAGVSAYHAGDEEDQIMFQGKDAKNIVTLTNDGSEWSVQDRNGRIIFHSDYGNVAQWVISNYNQYRNVLV